MKFTGHERDGSFDYLHARFRSPLTGRFLSVDKHPGVLRRPQTLNRYAYVSGNPLRKVDPNGLAELEFTIKTFIPAASVTDPLGRVFTGDARGFSTNPSASYRTLQMLRVETDPAKAANPLRSQVRNTGRTGRLQPNPASGKASVEGLVANGSRDAQGNAAVTVQGSATNPLVPGAPSIDYNLNIVASPSGESVSVTGTQDGFPAMEIYVRNEQGQVMTVYQFDPASVGNGLGSLYPGVGDQPVKANCTGVTSDNGTCESGPK
jgi:RHS repeat-associated protein